MPANPGSLLYERIFELVEAIPAGNVAAYGQIGRMVGGCSGRMVGFALASLRQRANRQVPWQRVINRLGKISLTGPSGALQRALLEDEGVLFDADGVIDLAVFGWKPES